MYSWFMRRPVMRSKMRRISSRARKPIVMIVVAPISLPVEPMATRCEAMRHSSIMRMRMREARSGMSSSMPRSFSTPRQYAASWKKGAT